MRRRLSSHRPVSWMRLLAVATLFSAAPPLAPRVFGQTGPDACALPAALRAAVQERFGSSRLLSLSDLYEDEQAAFRREHKGACPGMTIGRFFGGEERPATALVVLGVGPKKDIILVVARPALSSWTFVELDRLDVGATAVVSTGPPGTSGAGQIPRRDQDAVLLTAIETWQRAYAWNGRTFERRQTDQ